jgi:hypothetical protein
VAAESNPTVAAESNPTVAAESNPTVAAVVVAEAEVGDRAGEGA